MNFIFSCSKKRNSLLAGLVHKILFLPLENKINIFAFLSNILYIFLHQMGIIVYIQLNPAISNSGQSKNNSK